VLHLRKVIPRKRWTLRLRVSLILKQMGASVTQIVHRMMYSRVTASYDAFYDFEEILE
jgi:hypothetical protein